jgi:DNA-binding response OmpR family regulator
MYTVLFTDDSEDVRKLFCGALRQSGYSVLEASNGYEALALARRHTGSIHLLITDVVMPRMGGLELSRVFRICLPKAAVMFISGYPADTLDHGALFLQKPFAPAMLLAKITEVLGARKAILNSQSANAIGDRRANAASITQTRRK